MCLTRQHPVPLHGRNIGYKVVLRAKGAFVPCLFFSPTLIPGQWVTDNGGRLITDANGSWYKTGFHLFTRRRDAQNYADPGDCIATVRFDRRYITAEGSQVIYNSTKPDKYSAPVVVCQRIKIIKVNAVPEGAA